MVYDVIVVGGGTSGLMACVAAAKTGAKVLLLEKNRDLGKKILLTGGGRCNVTNNRPAEDIVAHIPGNGRFLYSAFSKFNNMDIMAFFRENGVQLKEEDHGRMFPVTDKARTILDTFITLIKQYGVDVRTNVTVKDIVIKDGKVAGVVLQDGESFEGHSLVVATGGKSVPRTGSTGDGYPWAEKAGHTIMPLFPTEVPLTSSENFIQEKVLQGLSLQDVALSVLNKKDKPVVTHTMDMIFTHFGISGPAVLRCSSFVYKEQLKQNQKDIKMQLDCVPDMSAGQLLDDLTKKKSAQGEKEIKSILKEYVPERLAVFFIEQVGLSVHQPLKQLEKEQLTKLVELLKKWIFIVDGSLPLDKSFVTGGGVSTKEIWPQTMMSKYVENLFFCGEILDIHGYTGGYNITAAFVTGHLSGVNAAENALQIKG